MSDRPWLEDADPALRLERDLLKRLNAEQPPSGSVEQGWAALAADISARPPQVPDIGAAGPTQVAAQVANAASVGIATKIAIGVALAGGALWMGSELTRSDTPPLAPQRAPSSASLPPSARPPASSAASPPVAVAETAPIAPETSGAVRRPSAPTTTLAEEGRALGKAHQLVQSGQPQQALEVLRASQARYPRSVLAQEREVLTIEALYASGASHAARLRARQFLKRHPASPHADRLARFVE